MYYNNCQNNPTNHCYKIVGEFYVYPSYYSEDNNSNDYSNNYNFYNNNFKCCQEKESKCNCHNETNKKEDCEYKDNNLEKKCRCCCFRRWWC